MADFLNRMLGRNSSDEEKGSGATAKDRLKMVLTHDRIQVSPEKLNEMRAEIIAVIARYVPEIDPDSVDISIEQTDRFNNRIVAQIPFSKARGKSAPPVEENTDLADKGSEEADVSFEATTLPKLDDEDREKIDSISTFNPDDDEPTFIMDLEDKTDDKPQATKVDEAISEAATTTTEAVSGDSDSSSDENSTEASGSDDDSSSDND